MTAWGDPDRAQPQPVSPGAESRLVSVEIRCPTFSWGMVHGAAGYELVVYRLEDTAQGARPVLREKLLGSVSSWTPPAERCLERGAAYAWSVRSVGTADVGDGASGWSAARLFRVKAGPSIDEVAAAMAVLQRYVGGGEEPTVGATWRGVAARLGAPAQGPAGPGIPAPSTAMPRGVPSDDRRELSAPSAAGPVIAQSATGGANSSTGLRSPTASRSGLASASAAPLTAPTIGAASLSVDQQIHMAPDSAIFKDGELFLWSDGTSMGVGENALGVGIGGRDTAIGYEAMKNFSYSYGQIGNVAIGTQAMYSATIGGANVAVGRSALYSSTLSLSNTAVGNGALASVDYVTDKGVGGSNTAVGANALANNPFGSANIAIGGGAGLNLGTTGYSGSLSWNIFIGNSGLAYDFNTIRIGQPFNAAADPDSGQKWTFIAGQVALGTEVLPSNQLVVKEQINGSASPENHVVLMENTQTSGGPDVLALKVGEEGNIEGDSNFITFFRGDDTILGEIEGSEGAGVNYKGELVTLDPTDSPPTCTASREGAIYYDDSLNELCFCNASAWGQVDGGGSC